MKNKTSFGKKLKGVGINKKTQTKFKKKTKLRIHMKKNILSFKKFKLDTM